MKSLLLTLSFFSTTALAAASVPTVYKNDSLEFQMIVQANEENISICDRREKCLEFRPVEFDGKPQKYELCDSQNHCTSYVESGDKPNVQRYREITGKCQVEITSEEVKYGGFMFTMGVQVVKVTRGSKNCKLFTPYQDRELFGLYLN